MERRKANDMKDRWADKTRLEKMAGAMYPSHLDARTQGEMIAANPEQRAGFERRIAEGNKMYGKATVVAPSVYDRVPGLKRVEVAKPASKSWWE